MIERIVKVIDPIGLHARPASVLVATASKYKENNIKLVINEEKIIDAKSILVVMSCAIEAEQEFKIQVDGFDSDKVLDEIITTLKEQSILVEV